MNAVQSPHLVIDKTTAEPNYGAVGDIIHYTIVATNDGNTTIAAVTVTDPNASGLSCTPANGSPLAPGSSMDCTASHTITQADIDAGHYLNTACVDDGAAGAAQACDDADIPAVNTPHLSIEKAVTEANYDSIGDVLNYTIVATNDGNTIDRGGHRDRPERVGAQLHARERLAARTRLIHGLHGIPHDHPGRHRRRPLPQHRLRR